MKLETMERCLAVVHIIAFTALFVFMFWAGWRLIMMAG